jgi:alanine racemase
MEPINHSPAQLVPNDKIGESQMTTSTARVTLEIDLEAIRRNYRKIRAFAEPLRVMGVLKANAYGLGVRAIAEALKAEGIAYFGVAEPREAFAIEDLGVPVLILGGILPSEIPLALEKGIMLPINSVEIARCIQDEAQRQGKQAVCHVLVDTGMGRLGIPVDEAFEAFQTLAQFNNLDIQGIYSHFPSAYSDWRFSELQISKLCNLIEKLNVELDINFKEIHISNSDGIHNIPSALQPPFTLARTGINLYGCFDLEGRQKLKLEEVIEIHSRIVSIRTLHKGDSIGYGRTCILPKFTRVGTVAIGYADGLPLYFSNRGYLLVKGIRCNILGRTSMDYTTIDLSDIPDAQIGDDVVCLGQGISVSYWAKAKKSNPYEVICSIGNRVERRVI